MSTRATIGLRRADGKIDTIICWHDAFVGEAGHTLINFYDTEEKVKALIAGGNLEQLASTPDKCEYQYRGDDGVPDDCRVQTLRDVDAFTRQVRDYCQDYGYLFENGRWLYYRPQGAMTPMP